MTNPTHVGTNTPATDATKATTTGGSGNVVIPTFTPSVTNVPTSADNPTVGADAYAQSLALQNAANKASGLNLNFGQADPSAWANLSPEQAKTLTAGETPYSSLPSNLQNPGYMAELNAVRSDPAQAAALAGLQQAYAAAYGANSPMATGVIRKSGGRTNPKNKPSTGTFIKKALMVVSKNRPSRSQRKG
jgi:hypothetical protein